MSTEKAKKILGHCGKMVGASKSGYRHSNPQNVVVFNANVCTKDGKIWYGDLDLTLELEKVKKLAKSLNKTVYVLYESDARFDTEENPNLEKAVLTVLKDGSCSTTEHNYFQDGTNKLLEKFNFTGIKDSDVVKVIPLDIFEVCTTNKKDGLPLNQFYKHLKEKLKLNITSCEEVLISNQDQDALEVLSIIQLRKCGMSTYGARKDLCRHFMGSGPRTDKNAVPGYVYILKTTK